MADTIQVVDPWDEYDYVTCGCCGAYIEDSLESNMDHETRGHDLGFGVCVQCANWQFELTMRPIFRKVRASLKPENQAKWDKMTDGARTEMVQQMLDEGIMSWGPIGAST